MLEKGAILTNRLAGDKVILLKVNQNSDPKDKTKVKIMLKCRYQDDDGNYHIYEFNPFELEETFENPKLLLETVSNPTIVQKIRE